MPTTTPTTDPVPSEAPQDLPFNAGAFDEFMNSTDATFEDRLGNTRKTLNGIEAEVNADATITLARQWATKTDAPVADGEYSAKFHAQAAAASDASAAAAAKEFSYNQSVLYPIVYDNFDRTNRTLNGDAATTGQVWNISGDGAAYAQISSRALYGGEGLASSNFYASLDYGQQITEMSATICYERRDNDPATLSPSNPQIVLIAQAANQLLTDMIHCQFTRTGLTCEIRTGGQAPPWDGLGAAQRYSMKPDAEYACRVLIDKANSRMRAMVNDGAFADTGWVTDARIGTMTLPVATYQIQSMLSTNAFRPSIRSVQVGPQKPSSAAILSGAPHALDATMATGRYLGPSREFVIPTFTTSTNGWYRLINADTFSGYAIAGKLRIFAIDTAGQFVLGEYMVRSTGGGFIAPINEARGGNPVTQVRVSTDGSTGAGLDIYISTAATYPVTVRAEFVGGGNFENHGYPIPGASAYSTSVVQATGTLSVATEATGQTSAADWYSVCTAGTGAGYLDAVTLEIEALRNDQGEYCKAVVSLFARPGALALPIVHSRVGGTLIKNFRVSRETNASRLDVLMSTATAATLTVRRIGKGGIATLGPVAQATAALSTESLSFPDAAAAGAQWASTTGIAFGPVGRLTTFSGLSNGGSTTIANQVPRLHNTTSGTIAGHTVTLPTGVIEGQEVVISTRGEITSLTVNAASGQSIAGGAYTGLLAANAAVKFLFVSAGASWQRVAA